jgi:hypothetical protein
MSIRCSQGHENPDEAQFCYECGEPLPALIPADATGPQDEASDVSPAFAPSEPDEATALAPAGGEVPQPAPAVDFEATLPAPDAPSAFPEPPQAASTPEAAEAETVTAVPSAPPPEPVAAPSVPQATPVAAQPHLMVEGTTTTFDLVGKAQVVIGREDAPSNSFPDFDLTPFGAEEGGVSRLHARLAQSGDAWTIEDLESTNFTFVNRKRIAPKTPTPLYDGDEIRLGRVGLRFKTIA